VVVVGLANVVAVPAELLFVMVVADATGTEWEWSARATLADVPSGVEGVPGESVVGSELFPFASTVTHAEPLLYSRTPVSVLYQNVLW